MSDITLSFQCEDYLRQWFIHINGGSSPVRLKKNTPESNCLQFALRSKSENISSPEIDGIPLVVFIPCFRFKNPKDYNSITETGRKMFLSILRMRFDEQIWYDLHSIYNFGIPKEDLIYTWMESHGIDPTEKKFQCCCKTAAKTKIKDTVKSQSQKLSYKLKKKRLISILDF